MADRLTEKAAGPRHCEEALGPTKQSRRAECTLAAGAIWIASHPWGARNDVFFISCWLFAQSAFRPCEEAPGPLRHFLDAPEPPIVIPNSDSCDFPQILTISR